MHDPVAQVEPRLYIRNLSVLLVEHNRYERDILVQILTGFKIRALHKRNSAEDAMAYIPNETADLLIVSAALAETDGFDFTRWLRSTRSVKCRAAPLLLLTGHTRAADVRKARDCGASLVIAKPVTPRVLFQRIGWLARDARSFVETEFYTGPDRRFMALGPPPDMTGRRKGDA